MRSFTRLRTGLVLCVAAVPFSLPTWSHAETPTSTRYGLFNLLDSRSKYNTNWFPEPLSADEMDGDQEIRLNYFHAEKGGFREDDVSAEIEKSFGNLSIELEVPYEHETESADGETDNTDGMGSIELSARHPFYQYVSPDEVFDLTLGARVELAIPTGSDVSKNTELVGGLYETLGIGEHFSIQGSIGYSTLFGPNEDGGEQSLEYALVFGYNLDFKSSFLSRITPVVEFDGETGLNHGEDGTTAISGVVGAVFAFESNKFGQPKLILGYVFPINDEARDESDWGITTSLIFEY